MRVDLGDRTAFPESLLDRLLEFGVACLLIGLLDVLVGLLAVSVLAAGVFGLAGADLAGVEGLLSTLAVNFLAGVAALTGSELFDLGKGLVSFLADNEAAFDMLPTERACKSVSHSVHS